MNRRLVQIRVRRERLLARAAAERDEVALLVGRWRGPLAIADRGVIAVRYLSEHPGAVLLATAALAVLSPRRAFRWARRVLFVWRGYRWALQLVERLPS